MGRDGAQFSAHGKEGASLSDLDLAGKLPDTINLLGPDTVRITAGDAFSAALEGDKDAKDAMRFMLEGGELTILRQSDGGCANGRATVNLTMPAPSHLILAGSGAIVCDALAKDAEVTIAGSGGVKTGGIDIEALEVRMIGSGSYRASGKVGRLDLSIAGSGDAKMTKLKVDEAEISIAGSGNVEFRSDGKVNAKIMGSGNVTVRGSARCRIKSFGSGQLTCKRDKVMTD